MRMELPERAVWPLPPRPLVLPCPLDSPCPSRLRRCLAPGRGLRSCKRIKIYPAVLDRARRRRGLGGGQLGRFGSRYLFDFNPAALVNVFAQAEAQKRLK